MNINTMTFVAPNLACGEAGGGSIPQGAVTDEQRSHRPNSAQPLGRQLFFAQTSLLAPYRPTLGYARRSRLVWAKNPLPRTSAYLCLRPLSRTEAYGECFRASTPPPVIPASSPSRVAMMSMPLAVPGIA